MNNDMLRNGSGYIDPTAYQGMTRACAGEIWTQIDHDDDYWIILAVNDKVMTALKLTSRAFECSICITCHEPMYTNPAMISYIFANRLGHYVKSLPKNDFEYVLDAVADALGICRAAEKADVDPIRDCLVPKEEFVILKKQLEVTKTDLSIERQNNETLGKSIAQLEDELDACKPYKAMYHDLLDRLIAKVGAAL